MQIQSAYENSIDCTTELLGSNYLNALIGNLLYTALPIYLSTTIIALIFHYSGSENQQIFNLYLYATLGAIGAKTRFWVNQRRKQRPIWLSVLILLLAAPVILTVVLGVFWLAKQTG